LQNKNTDPTGNIWVQVKAHLLSFAACAIIAAIGSRRYRISRIFIASCIQ